MEYFIDEEFLEDGQTIMLISLGIVALDGREFYVEFDFDEQRVLDFPDPFVRDQVLPHLQWPKGSRLPIATVRERLEQFLLFDAPRPLTEATHNGWNKPRFWGYYADYDWVGLCRIWGRMVDLPPWMPQLCLDLQQWWIQMGSLPGLRPPAHATQHHALEDARWHRDFYLKLRGVNP